VKTDASAIIEFATPARLGPSGLSSVRVGPRISEVRRLVSVVLAALVLAPSAPAATRADSPLGRRLAQALRVPHVSPIRSAALVVDLDTDETIFAQNASRPLAPASNEKLPLTYVLLTALGPSFRIDTTVQVAGDDLYLVGGGDPSLSRTDLATLASQTRAAGVTRVRRVYGDESMFDSRRTAPGWKASFYINESPPLSALTVDRAHYAGHVTHEPALAAALLFRDALKAAGVVVAGTATVGTAPPDAEQIASVHSPQLASLITYMDLQSDNFTAEILLKQLGLLQAARGSTTAGAQTVMRLLGADGIPLAGVRFVDGSGLSQLDRLTAAALVAILDALWSDPTLQPTLKRALPVAGRTGTLRARMRTPPLRGNVAAKTGTTSEASALAGFVKGRYVFAVLQNGHPLAYWWARRAQERFATVLAAQ
jgi:serine-type D-Ala-D-Ala carboxypeptidase/endopeptidase (penicillin-binding protein 4)